MWPRKQLDIGWSDLAFGVGQAFWPGARPTDETVVGADWIPRDEVLVSLSVRTGLDLLLTALRLPPGSEVLVSAVTIPDMTRILEHHGLVPVPIAVDAERLEPVPVELAEAITRRTRAILVAHLFGSRIDMTPVLQVAHAHNLLVVEDCAQAFVGREYAGHADSDVCLFSFGPIKTATALGGAVLRVRDPVLRNKMADMQRGFPAQSRWSYLARLAKYAMLKLLSHRAIYGLLVKGCRLLGIDYDRQFVSLAHSFGPREFFLRLRQRPCVPLVRLLQRRLGKFESSGKATLRQRIDMGRTFAAALAPPAMMPGEANPTHTFWVLPLRTARRAAVLRALREAGFDATGRSSLVVVQTAKHPSRPEHHLAPWLREAIFLPNGASMPHDEFARMREVVHRAVGCRPSAIGQKRGVTERQPLAPTS